MSAKKLVSDVIEAINSYDGQTNNKSIGEEIMEELDDGRDLLNRAI